MGEHHISVRDGQTLWALLDDSYEISLQVRQDFVVMNVWDPEGKSLQTISIKRGKPKR